MIYNQYRFSTILSPNLLPQKRMTLESINLFPETRYFRCKSKSELDHQCGGFASLLIIMALLVILSIKLNEAFNRHSVFFNSNTVVSLEPPISTISTKQSGLHHNPYMLAIRSINYGCSSTREVKAYNYTYSNLHTNNSSVASSPILLENCTADHFSTIPNIYSKFSRLGMSNWLCLPLNQTYEIGGSWDVSNTYKALLIQANCTQSCGVNNCGTLAIYQLSTVMNPHNPNSFQYFLQRNDMELANNIWNYYAAHLDENILYTDKSITPIANNLRETSFSAQPFKPRANIANPTGNITTDLWIERSSITKTIHRRYLSLIDVFSYVGGIFPSLFTVFFFMKAFGLYFFEMTFASIHFHSKETKVYHFGTFMKQLIYQVLLLMGCKKDNWKVAERRLDINKIINKLLDINYLFRRIQFLETAISVLLEKHQLKGIYLSRTKMRQSDKTYKKHRIRDRMIKYLNKKNIAEEEEERKRAEAQNKSIKNQIVLLPNSKASELQEKGGTQIKLQSRSELKYSTTSKIVKEESRLVDHIDEEEAKLTKRDNKYLIAEESSMLEEFSADQIDEQELSYELSHDLKKLFKEAKKKKDVISQKIVENIDEWLSIELQSVIDEQEEPNPILQIKINESY